MQPCQWGVPCILWWEGSYRGLCQVRGLFLLFKGFWRALCCPLHHHRHKLHLNLSWLSSCGLWTPPPFLIPISVVLVALVTGNLKEACLKHHVGGMGFIHSHWLLYASHTAFVTWWENSSPGHKVSGNALGDYVQMPVGAVMSEALGVLTVAVEMVARISRTLLMMVRIPDNNVALFEVSPIDFCWIFLHNILPVLVSPIVPLIMSASFNTVSPRQSQPNPKESQCQTWALALALGARNIPYNTFMVPDK